MRTTIFIATILILFGCTKPNVGEDFKFRHPNCKLITSEPGEGDMVCVYMQIDYLKPNATEKTTDTWQYWNLPEGWTHREIHLLKDTINNDVFERTSALIGKWKDGNNLANGQWTFQKDHYFIYDDENKTINGVWFLDIYNDLTLYHHSVLTKTKNTKDLIDEVLLMTYETNGDTVWFKEEKRLITAPMPNSL